MDLTRWTPVRMRWDGGVPAVEWCHTAGVRFDDPTFDQTVNRCLRHPFRLVFRPRTGMEAVSRAVEDQPGLPVAGFVFHLSRCGSTLVSQMLAAVDDHLVMAEAGPLDCVLRAAASEDQRVRWLRAMVGALAQRRSGCERRMFVKFDSWAVLQLSVVRRAFPDVPWIFIHRDPVEVLVSHRRRPGAHVIPGGLGADVFGVPADLPRLDYAARVLARIGEAALDWSDDPLGTFVDYADLPEFVTGDLVRRWDLDLNAVALAAMALAGGRDAKNPLLAFVDDRASKQAVASDDVRAAADRWLAPVRARLREAGGGARA